MTIKRLIDGVVASAPVLIAGAMGVHPAWYFPLGVMACLWVKKRQKGMTGGSGGLDDVLFSWPDKTPFTVRDMLRAVEIKGTTGSGKSSGSGKFFTEAIVKHPRSSCLIIAQKPEDKAFYQD